jgi:hypothetical protein
VPPIRFVLVGAVLGKAAATAALQIGASVFYRSHRNWCTVHLRKSYICVRPRVCDGRCVWVGLARTRRGAGEAAKGEFARLSAKCIRMRLRVNRPLAPSRDFADTLQCMRGTPMRRQHGLDECRIWRLGGRSGLADAGSSWGGCRFALDSCHACTGAQICARAHTRMRAAACAAYTQAPAALEPSHMFAYAVRPPARFPRALRACASSPRTGSAPDRTRHPLACVTRRFGMMSLRVKGSAPLSTVSHGDAELRQSPLNTGLLHPTRCRVGPGRSGS